MLNIIKKNFDFLKDIGYKRKVFSKNTDYEVYYTKLNNKIMIGYQLSIPAKLKNANVNEVLLYGYYSIDVIIKFNEEIKQISDCSFFTNQERDNLKTEIFNCKDILKTQVEIYAKFLKYKIIFL